MSYSGTAGMGAPSIGTMGMISSDRYGITGFLNVAVPKPKKPVFFRSERRAEGFVTEGCETVARRVLAHLDGHEHAGDLLAEMIENHLRQTPDARAADKRIDEILYETLSHALAKKYERAVYPESGPTAEYAGLDLYPRTRVQAKADKLAEKLARHICSRSTVVDYVAGKLASKDIRFKEGRSDLSDIKVEVAKRRADSLRERDSTECEVRTTFHDKDTVTEGVAVVNKWEALIKSLDCLQVSFINMPGYGTSSIRNSPSFKEVRQRNMLEIAGVALEPYVPAPMGTMPAPWVEDREKMMQWADHVSLRSLAAQVLDPFFNYALRIDAKIFDKFEKVNNKIVTYNQLRRGCDKLKESNPTATPEIIRQQAIIAAAGQEIINLMGSRAEVGKLVELAAGLRACGSDIPPIEVDEEATYAAYAAMNAESREDRRSKIAEQLAPVWVKKILAAVPQALEMQPRRLFEFMERPEVKDALGRLS